MIAQRNDRSLLVMRSVEMYNLFQCCRHEQQIKELSVNRSIPASSSSSIRRVVRLEGRSADQNRFTVTRAHRSGAHQASHRHSRTSIKPLTNPEVFTELRFFVNMIVLITGRAQLMKSPTNIRQMRGKSEKMAAL